MEEQREEIALFTRFRDGGQKLLRQLLSLGVVQFDRDSRLLRAWREIPR